MSVRIENDLRSADAVAAALWNRYINATAPEARAESYRAYFDAAERRDYLRDLLAAELTNWRKCVQCGEGVTFNEHGDVVCKNPKCFAFQS